MTKHNNESNCAYRYTRFLTLAASSSALLFAANMAHAQDQYSPIKDEDETSSLGEIVVTGSRVVRDGYNAPTPVNVLGAEEIKVEAPANIADFVNTLPSVRGSSTAASSSGNLSNGMAGISALNLRALGTGRTLVLLDGQRSVVSAATGQVDTNTFPQSLISRVDVVTGGASSAYGSDAVGGVVNFILDRGFTGVKAGFEYGETTYGDNPNSKVNLTYGSPFADGKGHVLLSGERVRSEGIHTIDRKWNDTGYFGIQNPNWATAGEPYFITVQHAGSSIYTPGGLITAGPLKGTYFGEGGTVNQLNYGSLVSSPWMVGGDWEYSSSAMRGSNSLQPDDNRDSLFGRVSYQIAPAIEVFAQASWAKYDGLSYYIQPTQTGVVIQRDNAFLPDAIKAAMDANNLTSFVMGTNNADMPASGSKMSRETTRFVVGADGEFSLLGKGFTWDAYYQHGETDTHEILTPTFNTDRLALATDAVFAPNGQIVCRSTLTNPTNGCVPLNRLGTGVGSAEGLAYVLGTPFRDQTFKQDVAAINFATSEIEAWAGPISLAFGIEWRKEQMSGSVLPEYMSGWKYGNFKVTKGDYDVTEGYVELVVPLHSSLDFNGAVRYTNYSVSGGVTTWKAGLSWQPIEDLRWRATVSKDIRAPNMSELYDAGTARTNSVSLQGQGAVNFVQNLQGNLNLQPETAKGLGIGVVYTPRFINGFVASIDYYDISVEDVISFVSAQNTANYCQLNNVQRYCDNMIYKDGVLQTIDLYYENLNNMKSRGVDYEASYRTDLDNWFSWGRGQLSLRAMATNYLENVTNDGVTAINNAGSNTSSTPDWVYRFSVNYKLGEWTTQLTARGVSDGVVNNAYTECTSGCPVSASPYFTIDENDIKGETYFDLNVSRDFTVGNTSVQGFFNVKNLFNTDPVMTALPSERGTENWPGYATTNRGLYDVLGRVFRVGLRFEF